MRKEHIDVVLRKRKGNYAELLIHSNRH